MKDNIKLFEKISTCDDLFFDNVRLMVKNSTIIISNSVGGEVILGNLQVETLDIINDNNKEK